MKVVLKNSSTVYEEVAMTEVLKTNTTVLSEAICSWESVADKPNFKVIIKITGYNTLLNPIPRVSIGHGSPSDAENVTSFFKSIINVDGNIGSIIVLEGTMPPTVVAGDNIKVGMGGSYNENFTLREYTYSIRYVFY